MELECSGATFTAPDGFVSDEGWVSAMAAASGGPVRANLVLHRRRVRQPAQLETLCGEICAELKGSIKGLGALALDGFAFDDGSSGLLLTYDCQIHGITAFQLQALRLDGDLLTSLSLTVDPAAFDDPASKKQHLSCLASVRLRA